MTVLRRLALAASIVLCALLAVTAAGSAAGIATSGGSQAYYKQAPTREKADAIVAQRLAQPFRGDANDVLYQWESSDDYNPSPGLRTIPFSPKAAEYSLCGSISMTWACGLRSMTAPRIAATTQDLPEPVVPTTLKCLPNSSFVRI